MSHHHATEYALKRCAFYVAQALVLACTMSSCNRSFSAAETAALLQTSDVLTVHDSERLLGRLLELQVRLDEEARLSPELPDFLRWRVVEPYIMSTEQARDDGYIGAEFRTLIVIASSTRIEPPAIEPADDENTFEEAPELIEPEKAKPISVPVYVGLLPVTHGSSAIWPVVLITPSEASVIAANLRDHFASQILAAYEQRTDDPNVWSAILNRLWVALRLGILEPEATARRNTIAIDSSESWLLIGD